MYRKLFPLLIPVWALGIWAQQPETVISGLQAPQKVIVTSRGNLLVSETSTEPNSGRVSFITRSGARRTLLDALPSGTDVTGGGSGPTALALRERTLYVAFGGGDSERRGAQPGTSMHNPAGVSSPLFGSIVAFRFQREIDDTTGTFALTAAQQTTLADGWEVEISDGAGSNAMVSLLARFPISEADRNAIYKFSNLWGLALTDDGRTLYVADASANSLARVETATGRWQRLLRFPPAPNPTPVGPPVIDAVPTSVRIYGDQVLMSFLSGFPFIPGFTRVIAVNPGPRTVEPFMNLLTSAVDVLWRSTDAGTQFFVLEFSTNQSANPAPPGRLLRYDNPTPQVMASDLRAPVSLAYDSQMKDLYVLELSGRLLRFRLP